MAAVNDDYVSYEGSKFLPYWLLRLLKTVKSPECGMKLLKKQFFNDSKTEKLLFARSVDDSRGVICSTLGRVIYLNKEPLDDRAIYQETMHDFKLTESLSIHLVNMPPDGDYNAVIKLCAKVAAEVHCDYIVEKNTDQNNQLQQLVALKKLHLIELQNLYNELAYKLQKISVEDTDKK